MNLDKNLTKLCKKRNLSIVELARQSGVSKSTLHDWMNGSKVQNLDDLKKIADVLKVGFYQLLFDIPDPYEKIGIEILDEIFRGDVRVLIQKIRR